MNPQLNYALWMLIILGIIGGYAYLWIRFVDPILCRLIDRFLTKVTGHKPTKDEER